MTQDPEQAARWAAVQTVPSDYSDYGGEVVRWEDDNKAYPDCSMGCLFWRSLAHPSGYDLDWGVCLNPQADRKGLLTWEHQAGYSCFVEEPEDQERQQREVDDQAPKGQERIDQGLSPI